MPSPQTGASKSMMQNSVKWSSNGAARDQGYSQTTSAPRSPPSGPVLKLVTQNERTECKQPHEFTGFEGTMEEEDEEKQREEREGKGEEGKEEGGKGREEEEEKAREEGDDKWMVDVPGNANDIVVMS